MVPLTMILIYIAVVSFLIYTFKNKKPLKWNEVFAAPFRHFIKVERSDDLLRIPGPLILPFFGTKWQNTNTNKLNEYYENLNKTYGDIVMEVSNNVPVISLFNRNDIQKVLECPSKFPFRPPTEIISYYRRTKPDRYASLGLVNEQGAQWAHLRSKLTPKTLESRRVLGLFCPDLNEICDDFVNEIRQKRNCEDNILRNFDPIAKLMTLEAACCLILGRRNSLQELNDKKMRELGDVTKKIFELIRESYFGNGLWKYFPTKLYKKFVENEEKAYDIIYEIIAKALKDNEMMAEDSDNLSILSTILRTSGLDDRDKISGIIDFINASQVGTNSIIFLIYYISAYPEVQEKIYEESLLIDEKITLDDIMSKAHYTRAVIHESFRISPAAFCLGRILEQDMYLSGYHIKAGNVVLCQSMIACKKEENFKDAQKFVPERWLNEKGEMNTSQCVGSSIVNPFGTGKRICPGKKFSEIELIILVIKLVRAFKIEYCSPFEQVFEFVLAPKGPIDIRFVDRF